MKRRNRLGILSGKMRVTWDLADAGDGTNVTVVCEDIPQGIRLEDNEEGSASSLQKHRKEKRRQNARKRGVGLSQGKENAMTRLPYYAP